MTCTTHHHACECREAEFARIEAERDTLLERDGILDAIEFDYGELREARQQRDDARAERDLAEQARDSWREAHDARQREYGNLLRAGEDQTDAFDRCRAERDRLRGALREILRYLDSTGQSGDHHTTLGEACGMDACVLCLAESVARAALSPAEQPHSNPGAPDTTGSEPPRAQGIGASEGITQTRTQQPRNAGRSLAGSHPLADSVPSVCPSCDGTGVIRFMNMHPEDYVGPVPCSKCGGSGSTPAQGADHA